MAESPRILGARPLTMMRATTRLSRAHRNWNRLARRQTRPPPVHLSDRLPFLAVAMG